MPSRKKAKGKARRVAKEAKAKGEEAAKEMEAKRCEDPAMKGKTT